MGSVLLSACTLRGDRPGASFAERAGRCLHDNPAHSDVASATSTLESVGSWLQIFDNSDDLQHYADHPVDTTVPVTLLASRDGGEDNTEPAKSTKVRIHGSMLPPVSLALARGGAAYLAMPTSDDLPVLFVLVRDSHGHFAFAGDCAYAALTQPLQRVLGSEFDVTMRAVIGLGGPGVAMVLEPSASSLSS